MTSFSANLSGSASSPMAESVRGGVFPCSRGRAASRSSSDGWVEYLFDSPALTSLVSPSPAAANSFTSQRLKPSSNWS